MRSAAVRPGPSDAVAEGLSLFQRLTALSSDALNAIEATDGETLVEILEQRAGIIERADALMFQLLAKASNATDDSARQKTSLANKPLLDAMIRLQATDAQLTLALASRSDGIARDLSALDHGGAARSAYGPRQRTRGNINVVR